MIPSISSPEPQGGGARVAMKIAETSRIRRLSGGRRGTSRAPSGGTTMKKAHDRQLIDTGTDKRYVRRDDAGRFKESNDVGRSLAQDVRKKAKNEARPGQGDKGDRKRD
jgi:hypothetical protein